MLDSFVTGYSLHRSSFSGSTNFILRIPQGNPQNYNGDYKTLSKPGTLDPFWSLSPPRAALV